MRIYQWLTCYLPAVIILLAGALPLAAQTIPNPFPPGELATITFANGLRLIVREDHSLPIVAMVVVVRGGAAAEDNTRGLAHYLEHLVFQGTQRFPEPLAPQLALEQVSGISNAVTTRDVTRYQAAVSSSQFGLLVNVLTDIILHPLLTDELFEKERAVILAEIQHDEDKPVASLINHAYQFSYRAHPYRYPPTGSIDDVLRMTAAQVRAYYARWYVPNNISVVFVGDVTVQQAIDRIKQAFDEKKKAKLPNGPSIERNVSDPARAHFLRDLTATYQVSAFPAPPSRDFSGMVATDLVTTLLLDGEDALLPNWWTRDGVSVMNYGAEFVSAREPGRFMLWAQTTPEMTAPVHASTLALLNQLATMPLPPEKLALAKQRLATQFLLENETYSQQAATLAFYEGLGGAQQLCRYLPALQSLTAEQVRAAIPRNEQAWVTLGQTPEAAP